jgi:glycosyltransferase involved in cell wall biosynthesis
MRVLHVSFSSSGGAGRVAGELVALQKLRGIDASLYSPIERNLLSQPFRHPFVTFNAAIDSLLTNSSSPTLFSYKRDSTTIIQERMIDGIDILHLHWTPGVVNLKFLREVLGRHPSLKVVWTMHDMFPFTGGCHHAFECNGFQGNCSNCPQVVPPIRPLIKLALKTKMDLLNSTQRIKFVAPSSWLARAAKQSAMLRKASIEVIPNPINSNFSTQKTSQQQAREIHGLDSSEEIAIMIAEDLSDPNKNIQSMVNRIISLVEMGRKIRILLVGENSNKISGPEDVLLKVGRVKSEELARLIPAADYIVVPSKMETAPSIILEAAALGVPCLVEDSNLGGVEMAEKYGLGLVSRNSGDLSSLLLRLASLRKVESEEISETAHQLAGGAQVLDKYLDLYQRS